MLWAVDGRSRRYPPPVGWLKKNIGVMVGERLRLRGVAEAEKQMEGISCMAGEKHENRHCASWGEGREGADSAVSAAAVRHAHPQPLRHTPHGAQGRLLPALPPGAGPPGRPPTPRAVNVKASPSRLPRCPLILWIFLWCQCLTLSKCCHSDLCLPLIF